MTTMAETRTNITLPTPPTGATAWQVHVYQHTHWDREWYQSFERYRAKLVGAVDRIIDVLEADPAHACYVLDGQTIVVADYLIVRPEQHDRLQALARSGRVEIGPWYILPDEFLVSGESLIRNLQEGRRAVAEWGEAPRVGYLPDPFGHIAQMPAILAGFGIDVVIFSRGMGDEWADLGNEFRWCAGDGETAVVASVQTAPQTNGYCGGELLPLQSSGSDVPLPYDSEHDAIDVGGTVAAHLADHARSSVLLVAAGADHFTIGRDLPELLRNFDSAFGEHAEVTLGGLKAYREALHSSLESLGGASQALGTWQGELRGSRHAPILASIFSARMHLKRDNARLQTMLERVVEPLLAQQVLAGAHVPAPGLLRSAWKLALQNQPHDSIGGCSVDETHEDMPNRTKRALEIADAIVEEVRMARGLERTTTVFNPHAHIAGGVAWHTPDDATTATPIWVPDQQPLTLEPLSDAVSRCDTTLHGARVVDDATIASVSVRVGVDGDRVWVESLDETGTPVARIDDAVQFVDEADAGDVYDFGALAGDTPVVARLASVSARQIDPYVAQLELTHVVDIPAALTESRERRSSESMEHVVTTVLTVAGDLPWVEAHTSFDNRSFDHRLRLRTFLPAKVDSTLADGHFAVIERPVVPPAPQVAWKQDPPGVTYCEHACALPAAADAIGVALLGRGAHEYEARHEASGTALYLTMHRSIGWLSRGDIAGRPQHAGPALPTPGAQCIGPTEVQWAIAPLPATQVEASASQKARVARLGARFGAPPVVFAGVVDELPRHAAWQWREHDIRQGQFDDGGRAVIPVSAPVAVEGAAEFSALMPATDASGDVIVRLFNPAESDGIARIHLPAHARSVHTARLDETPLTALTIDGASVTLPIAAGAIVTLRIAV